MSLPDVFDPDILALPLYDDAHRALAGDIGRWCAGRAEAWATLDAAEPAASGRALLADLGGAGWLRHLDPAEPASDLRALCLRRQALAYHEDLADFAYSIQELTAAAITRYGNETQQRCYLPGLATGTTAGALALSEPGAGSDLAAVALEAVADGDGFVLNGTKTWIAQGDIADVCVVLARTGDGPGPLGLTAFLVESSVPGFKAEPIGAIAPRSWAQLDFTDVRVGGEAVLGERGQGFVVALDILERARATVAAAAIGFARRAFRLALEHARTRKVYGGRLADLQLVKSSLARMDVKLSAASLLTARAAWAIDGDLDHAKHSSIAKLHSTEAAGEIVDGAVQIFGAAGLVAGSTVERLYRQIRSLRIYEGASEVIEMTIADAL
ncbi:acyl-CoA dehydrogenase domain protein [Catenulispora acidiphila DSM 44928]|uniref:Acyl-CoA dehydrogenase domain protein n=1 Tax=Catenulispora acidiphila (strain DSM 44928 / JCM 14897 / NBRC 102108 / NRRL B-24433 / ID139908) TaxID=479433 RepID=C7QKA1_CATAD|nr:acyl-CoA dehydrogenase [Catenulispora acidiphila]ACU75175.1 acyl-CoA dehydrogenase domain protein [Catenulispora acidiphila DSM 44928]